MPSPQRGGTQVGRHAAFGALEFAAPRVALLVEVDDRRRRSVGSVQFVWQRVVVDRVAVVALLALRDVDDAVAARLVRLAVRRAAVAARDVAVVADLAARCVDHAVAAALRLAVRAARRVRGVGVRGARVAGLAERGVDDRVAAARQHAGRAARRVRRVRVEPAVIALLAVDDVDDAVAAASRSTGSRPSSRRPRTCCRRRRPRRVSRIASPQRGSWQFVRHVVGAVARSACRCRTARRGRGSTIASPHARQLAVRAARRVRRVGVAAPRSHCSPIVSTMPLPQTSRDLQSDEQPSPETVLPSSQTSPRPLSRTPLPQTSVDWQSAEQPSPRAVLPSSHSSPASMSTTPLPQVSSDLQSPEQPSPLWLLPSSQTSPARCRRRRRRSAAAGSSCGTPRRARSRSRCRRRTPRQRRRPGRRRRSAASLQSCWQPSPSIGVAVVALLALRRIDDAVAARLVRVAVGRAAVAVRRVAVVADLVGRRDAVAAAERDAHALLHAPSIALPVRSVYEHASPSDLPRHWSSCSANAQPPWPSQTSFAGQSTSGQCVKAP